jgi:hypothetical protein
MATARSPGPVSCKIHVNSGPAKLEGSLHVRSAAGGLAGVILDLDLEGPSTWMN